MAIQRSQAGVRPDYFTARAVGYELQQEFRKRGADALIERVDHVSMRSRVFSPFGVDVVNDPMTADLWDKKTLPSLVQTIRALTEPPWSFRFCRPALIDDARWLECLLTQPNGRYLLVSFRLLEDADGAARIDDFRIGGTELAATEFVRQTVILSGFRAPHRLSEEESTLTDIAGQWPMPFQEIFRHMAAGKHNDAYYLLSRSPEAFWRTRIFRDLRARLAHMGSPDAQRDLLAACRSSEGVEPFLRYTHLLKDVPKDELVAAFDDAVRAYHGLPFLRAEQAELLLENGYVEEAFTTAVDVYRTNPFCALACAVAVHAGAMTGHHNEVFEALSVWTSVSTPDEIENSLKATPKLKTFLESREFREWKQNAGKPAGTSTETRPAS